MCKFSQEKYTKDAIANVIKKLHIADEYPYEILGDYAGLSGSMMRQIADGNRSLKGEYLIPLAMNLLMKDGNKRIANMVLPLDYAIVRIGDVKANGCPEDEVIDGGEALYMFRDGHKTSNVDVMDASIEQHEQVLERMKAERARKAGRKS